MATKILRSGSLRHIIHVKNPIYTQGNDGSIAITYGDEFTVYASVEPLSAKDFLSAGNAEYRVNTRITTRYTDKIYEKSKITFKRKDLAGNDVFRYFVVKSILTDPDSGFDYITILAEETTNDENIEY